VISNKNFYSLGKQPQLFPHHHRPKYRKCSYLHQF
jgi:hypothetical protein